MALVVTCLCHHENQEATKHVESSLVPRLDEGSSPSSSTCNLGLKSVQTRQTSDYQIVPEVFSFWLYFHCLHDPCPSGELKCWQVKQLMETLKEFKLI